MKNLILLCALLPSIALAQQKATIPNPFEFRLTDSVQAERSTLYTRARAWMASTYNSAQNVIQMDDREAGKLIGKAATTWAVKGGFGNLLCQSPIRYTITIDVKDNKYRCTLSDFSHKGCYTGNMTSPSGGDLNNEKPSSGILGLTKGQWESIRKTAAANSEALLKSLQAAMHEEAKANKDDW